jgi:hypothetical protein
MPCGTRARLTAYVAYQNLTFAELDVLLSALTDAGYTQLERALVGTEAANSVPVRDSAGRVIAGAALVVRGGDLPTGFGDLGFVLMDGAYVPLVPSDARAEQLLKGIRTGYGRGKAAQLAEQARRRYQGAVQRTTAVDGTVTIRVRF